MNKKYIIYGRHSSLNIIQNPRRRIEKIICTKGSLKFLHEKIASLDLQKVSLVERDEIEKILQKNGYKNALHQDLIVFTQKLIQPEIHEIINSSKLLVLLDELQDSQNIGAIMRSAALFNADGIVSTLHKSPEENSHIIKASCGAFEEIPFIKVVNLSQTVELLKKHNYWVIGMTCKGAEDLSSICNKFSKDERVAVVIGNEERGIRQGVERHCDFLAKIPINTKRGVDSLNAASAASIFLYEISKSLSL